MERQIVTSLKEVSVMLNISYYKARKIKDQIADKIKEEEKDRGIPDFMIFNKRYNIEDFKKYL
jgi:hypothetical protein